MKKNQIEKLYITAKKAVWKAGTPRKAKRRTIYLSDIAYSLLKK